MTPEEHEEARRRRFSEAEYRRQLLLAQAAARRADVHRRRVESKAADIARTMGIHERDRSLIEKAFERFAARIRQAGGQVPEIKPKRGRRPRPDQEDGGVPVTPDRPRNLSGGAAAALDFENE